MRACAAPEDFLADLVCTAADTAAGGANEVFNKAFNERFFAGRDRDDVTPMTVEEAREHVGGLPSGIAARCAGAEALVTDLRGAGYPTGIPFSWPGGDPRKGLLDPTYYRYEYGRFLVAVDLDC